MEQCLHITNTGFVQRLHQWKSGIHVFYIYCSKAIHQHIGCITFICEFGCGSDIFWHQFPTVTLAPMDSFGFDTRLGGAAADGWEKITSRDKNRRENKCLKILKCGHVWLTGWFYIIPLIYSDQMLMFYYWPHIDLLERWSFPRAGMWTLRKTCYSGRSVRRSIMQEVREEVWVMDVEQTYCVFRLLVPHFVTDMNTAGSSRQSSRDAM